MPLLLAKVVVILKVLQTAEAGFIETEEGDDSQTQRSLFQTLALCFLGCWSVASPAERSLDCEADTAGHHSICQDLGFETPFLI